MAHQTVGHLLRTSPCDPLPRPCQGEVHADGSSGDAPKRARLDNFLLGRASKAGQAGQPPEIKIKQRFATIYNVTTIWKQICHGFGMVSPDSKMA